MKRKQLFALGLAMVMAFGALAGCGDSGNTEGGSGDSSDSTEAAENGNDTADDGGSGEVVTIKIHTSGSAQEGWDEVTAALDEYTSEKIGVVAEWSLLPDYGNQINTIIASGEEYDACFTSNWLNPYNVNVGKGAYMDITDLLPEAAPTLYESYPDYLWEGASVNNRIYAVPNQQIVARQIGLWAPKEIVEGTGTDIYAGKKLTDFKDYFQKAYEQYGATTPGISFSEAASYCGYEYVTDYLACGVISMDDETAKVENFYETDAWKSVMEEQKELRELGVVKAEESNDRQAMKVSGIYSGTYKPGVEAEESNVYGIDIVYSPTDIEPYVSTSNVTGTLWAVSSTSKHPEETLKYLELLETDPYVINLIAYGIEGVHYEKVSDNVVRPIEGVSYAQQSWAWGNVFNTYTLENQEEDVWEQTKEMNDNARKSPILGFGFNSEPVQNELVNVNTVVTEYSGILTDERDMDELYDQFLADLEVAGVDKVIAEMQSQIDEFLANK